MSTTPTVEIQKLNPSAIVDLWVLDCSSIGGETYRFHAGTNELGTAIVWQGVSYQPMPIQIEGLEMRSNGALPRPTVRVANVDGMLSPILATSDDLIGAKVIRRRTLAKYLDAVNFPGGVNATADPNAEWPNEVFFIEQKTAETREVIEFSLVSALDLQGKKLPRRIIQATVCPWLYKGTECGYAGALGSCAKTLADCKTHFGDAPLPFGGFPAAGRIR